MTPGLQETIDVFDRWLFLPDRTALYAVLGAMAANMLDSDPCWLLLVGPPGGGKSELLNSLIELPNVFEAATLTEASLLSGTKTKERAAGAKGGLLREIGTSGTLIAKDFTSVLSMHREARAQVLAALREIYDGRWTRRVGTDGGLALSWSGKVGLIGGVTPTIDRHHGVMAVMGERFLLLRLPQADRPEQARRSLAHARSARPMRRELAAAVSSLFANGLPRDPEPLDQDDEERLVGLASFVATCRSAVERDGATREIELIPDAEAPTRIVVTLALLLDGLSAIGLDRDQAWPIVRKVGIDCIPALRLLVMDSLYAGGAKSAAEVGHSLGYPVTTVKRALEDLTAHRVVRRFDGAKRGAMFELAPAARNQYQAFVLGQPEMSDEDGEAPPEMSDDVLSLLDPNTKTDISGFDLEAVR